jgi:hypothetical protein
MYRRLEVHDDEAGALQMAHDALRCEGGPEGVRVAVSLASLEEPQSKGDRLGKVARIGGCELVLVVRHRISAG